MTIDEIKMEISDHRGEYVTIKYNLGRNKFEKYEVKIKEIYDYVFLVELETNNSTEIKSFSYSDVITKTIRIDY